MELTMSKNKLFVIVGVILLLISSSVFAHYKRVSWIPTELKPISVAPGESLFVELTLKNTSWLHMRTPQQLQVVVEGEIAPYISITQPDFRGGFKRGEEVIVGITITAPITTPLSVQTGKLVLKRILPNGKIKRVWWTKKLPVELTFSEVLLPPDPGEAGKDTLLGIDTDDNGVRDDIDRYIVFTHPDSAKVREALKQEAREMSVFLRDADSKELSRANALGEGASDCLIYLHGGFGVVDLDMKQAQYNGVIVEFLNTKARSRAYNKADHWLGGMVFKGTKSSQLKYKCTFDPDSLPN